MAKTERSLSDYPREYPRKYGYDSIEKLYEACQEKFDEAKGRGHIPAKDKSAFRITKRETGEILGEYARGKEFDLAAMDILGKEDPELYRATIVSAPIARGFDDTQSHHPGQINWDDLFWKLVGRREESGRPGRKEKSGRLEDVGYDVTKVSSDQKMMAHLQQESDKSLPENATDAKERILRSIVQRRGQKKFRNRLLKAYDGSCLVTKCDAEDALEACHISPYSDEGTNHVTNGLLLRADIHTLFDLKLIAIDEGTGKVLIAQSLRGTTYEDLANKYIEWPAEELRPCMDALRRHREEAGL